MGEPRGAGGAGAEIRIARGHVFLYRLYDVGEEIDLARAHALLSARKDAAARVGLRPMRGIVVQTPPLWASLGGVELPLAGATLSGTARGRVFDFGVVSVALRLAIPEGTPWDVLVRWSGELGTSAADKVAALSDRLASELAALVGPAVKEPRRAATAEDYTVFLLQALEPALEADDVREHAEVARLLLLEPDPGRLHASERASILSPALSYTADDLTVIDWNAALVLMPAEESDIPDILEFATAQLLELRVYDEFLDRELDRLYDAVGDRRVRLGERMLGLRHPYRALARSAMLLLLDVLDVTEKSENALKIVGDPFLAKVYLAAVEAFGLPRWRASLDRKLATLDRIASLLNDQADASRANLLELTVVVLIIIELIAILILGK
ncbi:MAG TPA: hypothetical protein VG389_21545 [Myxococcota bacterium]|jgi:hypothetical protein|nr:hypothetical protein [Myxococcota bacterium]